MKTDDQITIELDRMLKRRKSGEDADDALDAFERFLVENAQRLGELARDAVLMRAALREIVSMCPLVEPRKPSRSEKVLIDVGMIARAAIRPKPYGGNQE